ncbi:MAG TPA: DUF6526 family protein [Terriglobales bacterium]|nr:DUF6526 family protein [Terriglobales bacterium]
MAEKTAQSFANHVRWDPAFHFFGMPVLLITFIASIVYVVRFPSLMSGWAVVFFAAALLLALKSRLYALRVQDRVIRLEERLRLATLRPELRGRVGELTEPQLIGLRFACDAEAAALAERALKEKLSQRDIKKSVVGWRADYWRV